MKATVEVFWGEEPRERSEREFLAQLEADLASRSISAIILANFFTNSHSRQVDFLVITDNHVCHVELKNYTSVLAGSPNGPWSSQQADGSFEVIDRQNPYTQAFNCKMAISDDMHATAGQDSAIPCPPLPAKFYSRLDSIVCIFPQLADGSRVPSDYKVKTQGYADFIASLTTTGPHPGWTREHWMAFIRSLSLTNASGPGDQEFAASVAQVMVSEYAHRFKTFYSASLHELVPLPLGVDSGTIPGPRLGDLLHETRQVQLIGPTGGGKSHLTRHLVLSDTLANFVTVFIEAGMYEGRLSPLLDRSVARFSSNSSVELFRAAAINGQEILLVVDGYNECPRNLQERLVGDLNAFCLRAEVRLLLTGQTVVSLPGLPDARVLRVADLDEDHRRLVLSSYGSPEIYDLCQPFSTAYELFMAAECASELEGQPTRTGLLSAFVRRRLSEARSPAFTRETLRQIALAMDDHLVTSLPIDDVWRIAEEHLRERLAPLNVVDDVFACTIVRTAQGKFSFTHELLGRFLAAEGLLQRHREPLQLAKELNRPRHEDLRNLVLELEPDSMRLEAILAGLADWHLYAIALFGDMGPSAQRMVRAAALTLLQSLAQGMEHVSFIVRSEYQLEVSGGDELSASEVALLAAVGVHVFLGQFIHEVAQLLDATDAACRRSADAQPQEGTRPSSSFVGSRLAAALVRSAA